MTVVTPSWDVAVERNRSTMNIVNVTPGALSQGDATPIPNDYEYTVVIAPANTGNSELAVKLPDAAEIGDAVEVHNPSSAGTLRVFPSSGESIGSLSANSEMTVTLDHGRLFRKVASTNWSVVGS